MPWLQTAWLFSPVVGPRASRCAFHLRPWTYILISASKCAALSTFLGSKVLDPAVNLALEKLFFMRGKRVLQHMLFARSLANINKASNGVPYIEIMPSVGDQGVKGESPHFIVVAARP